MDTMKNLTFCLSKRFHLKSQSLLFILILEIIILGLLDIFAGGVAVVFTGFFFYNKNKLAMSFKFFL